MKLGQPLLNRGIRYHDELPGLPVHGAGGMVRHPYEVLYEVRINRFVQETPYATPPEQEFDDLVHQVRLVTKLIDLWAVPRGLESFSALRSEVRAISE